MHCWEGYLLQYRKEFVHDRDDEVAGVASEGDNCIRRKKWPWEFEGGCGDGSSELISKGACPGNQRAAVLTVPAFTLGGSEEIGCREDMVGIVRLGPKRC